MSHPIRLALLAVTLLLVAAAPAQAAFTLANPAAAPADTAAGGHSDFRVHVEPQGDDIKDLVLHLPRGVIGDPNATPRCTIAQFESNSCPATTQVGRASNQIQLGPLNQQAQGEIYNVQPRGAEPARLGIKVNSPTGGDPIRLESPVTSRPTDGGLDSAIKNIPNTFQGFDITITALDVVLFGKVPSGKAFMTNPTGCGPAETVFEAVSYGGEKATGKAGFTPTRCDTLPYAPGFRAILGERGLTGRRTNPPLTTIVSQGAGEANTRKVAVTLPKDIAVSLDRLGRACADAVFQQGGCAPTAEIGTATAVTSLLTTPLAGPVTFVTGTGTLPDLVLSLKGPLALTLRGANAFTPGGQQTTFDGLPDVPLSKFELAFKGGDPGLLTLTRDACTGKAPRLSATFTSQSGVEKTVNVAAKVEGCQPRAALRRAKGSALLRVDAGSARVRRVRVTLPKGTRTGRRFRVTGSGARGAKARLRGRVIEVTVPGGGARSVSLALSLRGLRRAITVDVFDTTGQRTRQRVATPR